MAIIAMNSTKKLGLSGFNIIASMIIFSSLLLGSSIANAQNIITNGLGEYREFNKPTLKIKLDLAVPTKDALEVVSMDVRKQLSFRMLEDRSARSWSQIWIQNLSINSPPNVLTNQADDLIRMTQAIPSALLQGDLVEFDRAANDLTLMIVDGIEVAEFQTPGFFEFLLSAFIGPLPPSSELKSSLLQAGDIPSQANTIFASLGYSNERSSTIASWLKPIAPEPKRLAKKVKVAKVVEEPLESTLQKKSTEKQLTKETEQVAEVAEQDAVTEQVAEAAEQVEAVSERKTVEAAEQVEAVSERKTVEAELRESSIEVAEVAEVADNPASEVDPDDAPIIFTADSLLATQDFQREMLTKIYRNMKYPRTEQRLNREGSLRISLAVNKDGSLDNVALLQQAEHQGFNEAALAAVDNSLPFSGLPDSILELPMTVEIPIQFRLQ